MWLPNTFSVGVCISTLTSQCPALKVVFYCCYSSFAHLSTVRQTVNNNPIFRLQHERGGLCNTLTNTQWKLYSTQGPQYFLLSVYHLLSTHGGTFQHQPSTSVMLWGPKSAYPKVKSLNSYRSRHLLRLC